MKTCILKKGEQSISVNVSRKKGTCSFKYYGMKPVRGLAPGSIDSWAEGEEDEDFINTDIYDGQLIWDQHMNQGFKIAF